MKKVFLFALLGVAACSGQKDRIIAEVCIPIASSANPEAEFARLVAEKGFKSDEARSVCNKYVRENISKKYDDASRNLNLN